MRFLVCSTYTTQKEAAAQQIAMHSATALNQRDALSRLREAFFGPTPTEQLHYQQMAAYEAEAGRWAKGRIGEELLFHTLGRVLDDRYLLLLDYPSPQKRGDIDGLLIGPQGITVYEVKAWTGTYWASQRGWLYLSRGRRKVGWVPARDGNPTQQVLHHADDLRRQLNQAGLAPVPVTPIIAIASDRMGVQADADHPVPLLTLWRPGASIVELLGRQEETSALTPALLQRLEALFLDPVRSLPLMPPPPLLKKPAQLLEEGETLYKAGHHEAALALYYQVLRMDPESARAHIDVGAALSSLKRYPEALAALDYALRLNPRFAQAHSNRGLVLLRLGRHHEAIAACDQALRLDPRLATAYNNRGLALLELQYVQDALAAFEAALMLQPTLAVAWANKGSALKRLGRSDESEQAYRRARTLGYTGVPGNNTTPQK
jgi:tetratricopeptide (TPR) repeat protein